MMLIWGQGMNGGRLTSTKCIYSCLVDYGARETSGSGLLCSVLWKHSVKQLKLLSLGFFLLAKLD